MRILHVNKFLYRRGGAESYMFDVAELQRGRGHTVEFWGMAHPSNHPTTYGDRLVDEIDFGAEQLGPGDQVKLLSRMVYSPSARRLLETVIDDFAPDVIHAHNIYHQLSPSILHAAKDRSIPVVLTMHDYKLVCPSYQLLAGGEVCERCVTGGVHHAVRQRCNRGSLAASVAVAIESGVHRLTRAYEPVAKLIAPSRFMADLITRSGRFDAKVHHIPHFTELAREQAAPENSTSVVFAGRLAPEKGLDVLLDAAHRLERSGSDARFLIAGDGPDASKVATRAERLSNVDVVGRLDKPGVDALLAGAAALVVPSVWHENQPMVILEALAAGLPVVASDIGGISELVVDTTTGLLVPPADAHALASAVTRLIADPDERRRMGHAGRDLAARSFAETAHLDALEALYQNVQPKVRV